MAGMHSILKVNPTYVGVDGKIYQDHKHVRDGKSVTVIKEVKQCLQYRKGSKVEQCSINRKRMNKPIEANEWVVK